MLLRTFASAAALPGVVLWLAAAGAPAGDAKAKPALAGAWVVDGGELKIEFADKNLMKIYPHGENKVIVINCEYAVEKGKPVKAKITGFDGTDQVKQMVMQKLPIGLEFNFRWTVKDDAATLADVKGDNVELLKSRLENPYRAKQ